MEKILREYKGSSEAIKISRYFDAIKRINELQAWNALEEYLKENKIERLLIDANLANAFKKFLYEIPDQNLNETDINTIKCGGPSPRPPKPVGNVRGEKFLRSTNGKKGSLKKATIVLQVDSHYSGSYRITEEIICCFSGLQEYFDILLPIPMGRYSIESNGVIKNIIKNEISFSHIYDLCTATSFADFWSWKQSNYSENIVFEDDYAKELLRNESGNYVDITGIMGRLFVSDPKENEENIVQNMPVTNRRLCTDVSYPLYFLGNNVEDIVSVELIVIAQRPAVAKASGKDFNVNSQSIETIALSEYWVSKLSCNFNKSSRNDNILVEFQKVYPYSP